MGAARTPRHLWASASTSTPHAEHGHLIRSQRALPLAGLLFGIASALVGGVLVAGYILGTVVARLGEPDQSLLFWYLPILFLGLSGVSAGIAAGTWGILRLRRIGRRAE